MYYHNFFKRLLSSLIIGGQAISFIFRGKISKNDLFEQLMESGPGSLLIVLITGIAAGTVFNIHNLSYWHWSFNCFSYPLVTTS